ncbi:DUF2339 domain-containing protein [Cobetia sp. L2A1]|uniref:DUF2339 domain-containing protein n=1 Tax=Cobetia sp. L2A1 TaxID=2686360 RepID=UPI00131ECA02|nr:DUF2339 domain-containing protein [Cobetia sp. L2A1]
MILVGALSLVMAGVLLVGYSLDQGLLGPGVRLALGLGFGVIMGLLAEWLRLRTTQSSSLTGAISGAGSLVVAASLLAGHYLLSLISLPTTLFTLALLSLWTMERARHHGPWLAALGMLGGYALPLALPVARLLDGSANLLLLCHIGVIALACRLLYQQVAMNWLYWGGLLGAVGWWLMLNPAELSILEGRMLGSIWLGAIALAYLSPWRGVLPIQANSTDQQEEAVISDEAWYPWQANVSLRRQWLAGTLLGATIALSLWCQSIESSGVVGELSNGMSWGMIGILPMLVIAWSSRRHAVLWSMLLVNVTLWLLVWATTLSQESGTEIIGWPLLISLTLLILARWQPESIARTEHLRLVGACWWALATLTPLFAWMLAIWQGVMPGNTASGTGEILLNGALPPLIWGLACWIGANRFYAREGVQLAAGLWLPAQFGIFLSLVIGLEGPSLTLALALQLLGLTACEWRWWRNSQSTARSLFSELTRLLAWGLVLRLTYEAATGRYVDLPHWPLQVFLPVLACVALASAGMRHRPRIQLWLEGVVVQLAVATPVLEIRYLLTGGEPFTGSLSLPEASLQILALAGVAAGYTWRAKGARSDVSLYRWLAMGVGSLTIIAWCSAVLLAFNPLWYPDSMGAWPILNWLLPAYGIPALGAAFAWHLLSQGSRLRRLCEGFGLLSGGLWVGLNLRHHWHGEELGLWHGVVQAELYTYSLALLCIAAALVVSGAKLQQQHWQRVGQGVLILAVIKVGAWDTATLEGLWRAGSWLGLGTALMLLAGLFRRLAGAGSGDK